MAIVMKSSQRIFDEVIEYSSAKLPESSKLPKTIFDGLSSSKSYIDSQIGQIDSNTFNEMLAKCMPGNYSADHSYSFMGEPQKNLERSDFSNHLEYLDYKVMMIVREQGRLPVAFAFVLSQKEIDAAMIETSVTGNAIWRTQPEQEGHYSLSTRDGVVRIYSTKTPEGQALLRYQGAVG